MNVRWWRVGVCYEEDGDPWTWTLHVRAFTEKRARELVAARVARARLHVYACAPSEPLLRVEQKEEIVAEYGPYRRSWLDPALADLHGRFAADS